jgi:hypothetical protein
MSNLRTRLYSLAGIAVTFAGMSYAQTTITCNAAATTTSVVNPSLRSEGETELVADFKENAPGCTVGNGTGTSGAITGAVYATLSLPVTSKSLTATQAAGAGNAGNSEAVLVITDTTGNVTAAGPPAVQNYGTQVYYGTVTGNQIAFTGVVFPAAFTFAVQNVRVNASTGGAPQVTETVLLSYASTANTTSNAALATQNVGYVLQSLSAVANLNSIPATGYVTCVGNVYSNLPGAAAATASFTLSIKELFGGAFKTAGPANGAQAGEGGTYVNAATSAGVATTATQINVTLGNVPAGATVYMPQSISVNGTTLTMANTTAATGPTSIVAYNNANAATYGAEVGLTATNNGIVATYTVTASNSASGATTFNIPVFLNIPVNTAVQTGVTAGVYYSPTGAVTGPATTIPTFVASTATPLTESAIGVCATNLLFTFVTNQLGFDTGVAISNTSTDNLGVGGKSAAANQTGTCTLSFYGAGAPNPAVAVADPAGAIASGATHTFTISQVAPGFQGYMIAACPFQYAHGFAFITYNLTQANGVAEGYLAEVLNGRPAAGAAAEPVTF